MKRYKEPYRRYASLFIRRCEQAAYDYAWGRQYLLEYFKYAQIADERLSLLSRTIGSFEACVINVTLADHLVARLMEIDHPKLRKLPGAKSEDDLYKIYNRIKHFDEDLIKPNTENLSVPLWISDEGIHCSKASVSWPDLVAMLLELRKTCEFLTTPPSSEQLAQHKKSKGL